MSRKLSLTFFILINVAIFSQESADFKIAEKLFDIYNDDINLIEVNKVLEFYSYDIALHKKAELLDNKDNSLFESKKILEESELSTLKSKLHYISLLYRLTLYHELLNIASLFDISTIKDSDTFFYVADSYIRTGRNDKADTILYTASHLFPEDLRFIELQYLIKHKVEDLYRINNSKNSLESLMRLYNRINDKKDRLQIEVLLEKKLKELSPENLNQFTGNFQILVPLYNVFSKDILDGKFSLDADSDTFPDTQIELDNGKLKYKGVDLNRDNLVDYEVFLKDGVPELLNINSNSLMYDNYPYIDYVILRDDEVIIYDLYKNSAKLILKDLISQLNPIYDLNILSGIPTKSETHINENQQPYLKKEYRNRDSYIEFSELSKTGNYDRALLYEGGNIVYGLRDLNSDGVYDLSEVYDNNKLIGAVYSSTGIKEEYTYIETIESTEENILMKSNFQWWSE